MYSFQIGSRAPAHGRSERAAVPRIVYWVGLSSLLADISAESVASALPVFLFTVLQLSPLAVGFLDGLYQGGAALVSVVAAYFADRRRNNRGIALLGYALSAVSRLGLIASGSLGLLVAMVSLCIDRVGKGIRTAPRDAIIAGHTPPAAMGAAFGVHRALDAVGAFVGPLVGAALLWLMPGRFEGLFWASFVFGVVGVLVFRARATEPRVAPTQPNVAPPRRACARC
jgi:sugar phosphate permease